MTSLRVSASIVLRARWALNRNRLLVLLCAAVTLGQTACGSDPMQEDDPEGGVVSVRIETLGPGADADGYTLAVDGRSIRVPGDTLLAVKNVHPGALTLELNGLSGNCSHRDGSGRTVTVAADGTAYAEFVVECFGDLVMVAGNLVDKLHLYYVDSFGTPHDLTGVHEHATFGTMSPDGTTIIYSAEGGLWKVHLDGSDRVRLTPGPDAAGGVDWSEDGSRLVYWVVSNNDHRGRLVTSDPDGADLFEIVPDDPYWPSEPDWSPDGTWIAYSQLDLQLMSTKVFMVRPDGTDGVRLTSGQDHEYRPRWSPDGRYIAFWSNDNSGTANRQIHVLDAADASEVRVSPEQGYATDSQWSPDSKSLVYEFEGAIYRVGVGGSESVRLTADGVGHMEKPVWSADGGHVYFVGINDLYVVGPDGAGLRSILRSAQRPREVWPVQGK